MNITDHENPSPELPNFELAYAFDDAVKPTQVTVFPEKNPETTTHWISIEKEYTRDLDTIAGLGAIGTGRTLADEYAPYTDRDEMFRGFSGKGLA